MNLSVVIVDTYYPAFLSTVNYPKEVHAYSERLDYLLKQSFGTFDAFSRGFKALGWTVTDIIGNDATSQRIWGSEKGFLQGNLERIAMEQIRMANPDVVLLQDVSFFSIEAMRALSDKYVLAAQISCAMPDEDAVKCLDLVFTSFPHYLSRFTQLGVSSVFMPLAFDPVVLERTGFQPSVRDIPVLFVGGYGRHWQASGELLNTVAKNIPGAMFFGYGFDRAPAAVRARYFGEAWGVEMYRLLQRSRIVLNRHGEVAQGYTNNLRTFEATGCGAMLLTEKSKNIDSYFSSDEVVTYETPDDAVQKMCFYLDNEDQREAIAQRGQARTLTAHTYAQRMPTITENLEALLQ